MNCVDVTALHTQHRIQTQSNTRMLEASIEPPFCFSTTAAFYRTSQTTVLVTAGWRRLTQCQAPVAAGVGVRLKVALLLWCQRALARSLLPHHCSLTLCLPQAVFLTAYKREWASANVASTKQKTHVYLTNLSVLCFLGNGNKDGSSWMQQLRQLGFG